MKCLCILLLAVALLAGCGGDDSDDQLSTNPVGSSDRIEYSHSHDGEGFRELVLQYHGHTLYCLDQRRYNGNAAFGGLSCDWVRYHNENDPKEP